ncbi:MAG: hypothetical protein RSD00_03395 [Bacilli bacterium]
MKKASTKILADTVKFKGSGFVIVICKIFHYLNKSNEIFLYL